jgi:hypothetical protein
LSRLKYDLEYIQNDTAIQAISEGRNQKKLRIAPIFDIINTELQNDLFVFWMQTAKSRLVIIWPSGRKRKIIHRLASCAS